MANESFLQNLINKILRILFRKVKSKLEGNGFDQHVVPFQEKWAIKREGSDQITESFENQDEAIARGRQIAKNYRSNLIIHRKDGTIREVLNYSN